MSSGTLINIPHIHLTRFSALVGFLISLTPLSCDLMGWRGAGTGNGSADIGAYFFFGGLLMVLGGLGEVSAWMSHTYLQ